ncbi:hypothetical protein ACFX2C_035708 [Malus domestica]
MGFLLKEALKRLCGANQEAYAVFWKIGCKNPNGIQQKKSSGKGKKASPRPYVICPLPAFLSYYSYPDFKSQYHFPERDRDRKKEGRDIEMYYYYYSGR